MQKKDHPARPAGHTRAVPFSHFPRFFQILFSQDLHNILMHQMLNSLLIQSLDNLNCHADGAFYIFDSTEIIVAVYITAWNAKYQVGTAFPARLILPALVLPPLLTASW